jgi:AcrR family transcriptional regulator
MATVKAQNKDIIQNTKEEIVNVARKLFSEYTYLGVSMSDIAQKINITKGALYYHFTSKNEIYKKVLDEVFTSLNTAVIESLDENNLKKRLFLLTENYLKFGFKEKNLIKAFMIKVSPSDQEINDYVVALRGEIISLIEPTIKEMFASKKNAKKIDIKMVTSLYIGMMHSLVLEYSILNKKVNTKKVSEQIIAVLF